MSLTVEEARDLVSELVNAAWLAAPLTAAVPMQWDDVKADKPGEAGVTTHAEPFARTTVRIIASPQSTQGRRRFETTGTVVVQIFTAVGDGHAAGDPMAKVVTDALRGHVGGTAGVWFFNIVPIEIGVDGPWFQINVEAALRFQELAP